MRQTFSAYSFDANLPLRFGGEVHSTFSRAFNIRTKEDELISVVAAEKLNGPNRILLQLPEDEDFISLGMKKGMKAARTAQEISIDQGRFLISLKEAQRWLPKVEIEEKISSSQLKNNLSFFQKSLSIEKDEDRISQELRVRVRKLTKSIIEEKNLSKVSKNVKRLIGFGKGLTPSGDDFLVGLVASLHFLPDPKLKSFLQRIKEIINLEKNRTTFLSGKFLEYASQGRFSETILDLLEAIFYQRGIREAVQRCLDFGASSGRNTVLGVVEGLGLIVQSR